MRSACHFVYLNKSLVIKDTQLAFFSFSLLGSCGLSSVSPLLEGLSLFCSHSLSFIVSCLLYRTCSYFFLHLSPWRHGLGDNLSFLFHSNDKPWHFNQNSYYMERESKLKRGVSAISLFAKQKGTRICVMELSSWRFLHLLGSFTGKCIFLPFEKNLLLFIILDKCPWMLHLLLGAFLVMK